MRIAQILGTLGGAAVAFSASSLAASSSTELLPSAPPVTSTPSSYRGVGSTSVPHAPASANLYIPPFTTAAVPTNLVNATTSHTAGVTGGAIPQQMQASMAGLLGFCIMGLVML